MAAVLIAVFGIVWLLLWGAAAFMIRQVLRGRAGAVEVTGEVVGHGDYVSHGRTMFFPRYRVVLPDGRTRTHGAGSTVAKSWKSPAVGTRVTLLYRERASDDEEPFLERGLIDFLPSILLGGVGAIFAALTVGLGLVLASS